METQNTENKLYKGQCKWFNDRCGYGFISYSSTNDLNNPDKDIFVHFTNILSKETEAYKALQSGEYVQFNITSCDNKDTSDENATREQAVNITGIDGGKLLNEYRNHITSLNDDRKRDSSDENSKTFTRPYHSGKGRGRGHFNSRGSGRQGNHNFRGTPPTSLKPQDEWTPQ